MWAGLPLLLLLHHSAALFPGRMPDEGDVRHLYPKAAIAIGLGDHAHVLPYLLGWLENIDYPKSRVHLELHLKGKEDSTRDQILWWRSTVSELFASVNVVLDEQNWEETALRNARLKKSSKILITTGNELIRNGRILQDLSSEKEHVIVTALMSEAGMEEPLNVEKLPDGEGTRRELFSAHYPLLIQLSSMDSSYLTFDSQNLPNYQGSGSPLDVFYESARRMAVRLYLDSGSYYGVHLSDVGGLVQQRRVLRYHLCDLIVNDTSLSLHSRFVRPWAPEPDLWNVDRIYLINLKRRPDRLRKMTRIFEILGIDFTVLEATDWKSLPEEMRVTPLLDYEDPITKQPLKTGEIGCFLSHYRIWTEVVRDRLKRVIVFEDDLRFAVDGMERVRDVLEDLDTSGKDWDLIYLGRKKMDQEQDLWVPSHRHLSTVGYSYWTLGYLLSHSGAEKLLAPKPVEKLVPVDEYLPIMFDRHPNEEWMAQFPGRTVEAFTLYPLVVYPQRYAHEETYISDTVNSISTAITANPPKEEL